MPLCGNRTEVRHTNDAAWLVSLSIPTCGAADRVSRDRDEHRVAIESWIEARDRSAARRDRSAAANDAGSAARSARCPTPHSDGDLVGSKRTYRRAFFGFLRYADAVRAARSRLLGLPVIAALCAAGCSGGSGGDAAGGKPGATRPGAGVAGGAGTPRATGPLSEVECMQLLDHYLELALAEKRATLPPEEMPTDEQVARIRVDMRARAKESCVGLTERDRYDCAMKARTTRALGMCLAGRSKDG